MSLKKLIAQKTDDSLILTPHINNWLAQHSEEAWPDDVVEKIAEQLRVQPRIRSGSFSASSAGFCDRRQVLGYLGKTPNATTSPELQNLFNDGKWRHLRWQAMLLSAGLIEDIEVSLKWPRMRSKGSVDGVGFTGDLPIREEWKNKTFGFELKGMNPFVYQKWASGPRPLKPNPKHLHQMGSYFLSGGFDLFIYIVEDKATQSWEEVVVEPDPRMIKESEEEIVFLNKCVDNQTLPPILQECQDREGAFKGCPYGQTKKGSVCLRTKEWDEEG